MMQHLLNRFRRGAKLRAAREVLEAGLGMAPADRDLTRVLPIILPAEALEADWPGPIVPIAQLPFCVAWATCGEMNSFFYVTEEEARFWDDAGIAWRAIAMKNLSDISATQPASGEKLDDDGAPFLKVMLHKDAVGPSRLLLPHLFDDVLGEGYEVAIPERTCAIAYRKNLSLGQAADVSTIITGCYRQGTEPMSPERFKAYRFWESVEIMSRR